VTSRWIERAGVPWFPVTGEVHYSRTPRARWSEVLGHARAGGLTTVATYVFWQAHEPVPGEFRWDDDLDLRAFVQLAAAHGLEVVVRLGPWVHGEARHGGFPDWLVRRSAEEGFATRTDDPVYLDLVTSLYGQVAAQLRGLTHAEGGPVVGAQVENELYDQPRHLAALRETAEALGLRVPLWTATGWGGAQLPPTLLPVYSAYADGFWEDSATGWPAFAAAHFRYSTVRDDLGVGADLREALDGVVVDPAAAAPAEDETRPFATCELGGGMHVAYHRRPLVTPDDVAALALAKIGSGSVWQGYYLYAGGTQRVGPHGSEQESHATGYPNDVPTRSYDFHAPVGEHGQVRRHHHLLRLQHLWLQEEGPALARATTTVGGGGDDPAELRWAVRSDGTRGHLFATTYQPAAHALPAQHGVQLSVRLDDGRGGVEEVTVPHGGPITLPAGVSVVWPLRHRLAGGIVLRSATARLVTRVSHAGTDTVVLVATPGVAVELVLEGHVSVAGPARGHHRDGLTVVQLTRPPGPTTVVEVQPGVRLLVLDEDTALRLYRLPVAGRERLVLSDVPLYAADGGLVLHTEDGRAELALLPGVAALSSPDAEVAPARGASPWQTWTVRTDGPGARSLLADVTPATGEVPAARRGGPLNRLSAPTDFSGAARLHVEVPDDAFAGADRVLLRIDWTGDVGRAVVDGEVVSDHFWHGRVWDVDLTPFRDAVTSRGLDLQLLPWRGADGVWVDPSVRGVADGVHVRSVELRPTYRVVVAADG